MTTWFRIAAWGLLLFLPGCAYYSTSATGGSGIRSVAIPLFENESLESGIHQTFTDSLIQAFLSDGALKVVDEDRADVILRGTVMEVREEPFTYREAADQFQILVFLDVDCYDTRTKKSLWEEKRLRGYGVYSASLRREEERDNGLADAFKILTRDIVDRIQVGGW